MKFLSAWANASASLMHVFGSFFIVYLAFGRRLAQSDALIALAMAVGFGMAIAAIRAWRAARHAAAA